MDDAKIYVDLILAGIDLKQANPNELRLAVQNFEAKLTVYEEKVSPHIKEAAREEINSFKEIYRTRKSELEKMSEDH